MEGIMAKTRLCILFGGRSSEHEVSLVSSYGVLSNVDRDLFDVKAVGITREGKWFLYEGDIENIKNDTWANDNSSIKKVLFDPAPGEDSFIAVSSDGGLERFGADVVFPVLHGSFGEDGTLQGLLSLAGVPFVGSDHTSSGVCMDKVFTKRIINEAGFRQAKAVIALKKDYEEDPQKLFLEISSLGYPVFVKPSRAGSSVGVSKVKCEKDLGEALEKAFSVDSKVLIEEGINGRECEVAVMESGGRLVSSVAGEIDPGFDFYDYETKYENDNASYYIPARLDGDQMAEIKRLAEEIFTRLDCRTLSRVDFFVCDDGEIVFNEINTIPGFTPISMYPKLFMHSGMTYKEIITALVKSAAVKER